MRWWGVAIEVDSRHGPPTPANTRSLGSVDYDQALIAEQHRLSAAGSSGSGSADGDGGAAATQHAAAGVFVPPLFRPVSSHRKSLCCRKQGESPHSPTKPCKLLLHPQHAETGAQQPAGPRAAPGAAAQAAGGGGPAGGGRPAAHGCAARGAGGGGARRWGAADQLRRLCAGAGGRFLPEDAAWGRLGWRFPECAEP